MKFRTENLREPIAVIRPVYTDNGDGCEIITDNGESFYDPRSMKSVRRALARTQALDLSAQGLMVRHMVSRSGVLPFYLDYSRIYVPFKMRKPLTPNDYCYGYIRLDQAADIEIQNSVPVIRMVCGGFIKVNSTLASARQNLEMGRRLAGMLAPQIDEEERLLQAIRLILAWLKMESS